LTTGRVLVYIRPVLGYNSYMQTKFEKPMEVFGVWFDQLAVARHKRSKNPNKLMRAHIIQTGKKYALRQYVYPSKDGNYWSYRLMSNGKVRESYFPIDAKLVIHVEEIPQND